jgi:hypothetical protein
VLGFSFVGKILIVRGCRADSFRRIMAMIWSPFLGFGPRVSLCRADLIRARTRAVRRGVWFKVLSRVERAEVDLSIRLVGRVRSFLLARVLDSILGKLFEAMESRVSRLKRAVGLPLARKLSTIAQSWGCKSADGWTRDSGFIQFLTVGYMNACGSCRV